MPLSSVKNLEATVMLKPKRQRVAVIAAFVHSLPPAQGRSFRRNVLFFCITLGVLIVLAVISSA